VDKPLKEKEEDFLVDRKEDIEKLRITAKFQPFGIFGICGETGIGKTTVLNFLKFQDLKVIIVSLTERENKETILYDLLYKISDELAIDKNNKVKQLAKKVREWIVEEVSSIKGFSLGISLFANGSGNFQKSYSPRFNVFNARSKLSELLDTVRKEYGKVLLIVDELDKEEKKDVLNVLDSLKTELHKENLITLFSLPYSIYREYRQDRMRWNASGNLENIINDVTFLSEIKNSEIRELLLKRLEENAKWFESDAIEEIVLFSDGNPRDALWMAQKVALDNYDLKRLTKATCKQSIRKFVKEYSGELQLTDIQKKALKALQNTQGGREQIIEQMKACSIKHTTAYSTFERLTALGLIIERQNQYVISGKARLLIEEE
jgi:predicted KAP-like P-loop ATPase